MNTEPPPPPPISAAQDQGSLPGHYPSGAALPRLWNPNVAGLLSVLLTPLFGPVIHGLNWRALGHERDTKISFIWVGALLVAILIIGFAVEDPPFLLYFALILAWHFAHGRKQIAFAKSLPGGYQKRNMWIPAGAALGAVAALIVMFSVIGAMFGAGADGDTRGEDGYANSGEIATMREDGSPAEQVVLEAASTLDLVNGRDFKRGTILESMGGNLPVGTLIYPIKFEGYPLPVYFSRDEFEDWAFSIGDNPRLIPVEILTEADRRKQEEDAAQRRADEIKAQKANEEAMRVTSEMREKQELKQRAASEEQRKRDDEESELARIEAERSDLEEIRRAEEERERIMESNRLAGERRRLERDLQTKAIEAGEERTREAVRLAGERQRLEKEVRDKAIEAEMERTKERKRSPEKASGDGGESEGANNPVEAEKDTAIAPSKKGMPTETEDAPTPDKSIRLAEAKADLAALNSQIASEQKRWADATFIVNKLTNFRKSPVEKNSPAHHQSYAALKIIQEVEQKAPVMKADKVRLETLIEELSR